MNNIRYWLQSVAVILVAVVLFYVAYRGITTGTLQGRSEVVLANTKTMIEGLSYFYTDQNRYPSPDEFADRNIMLTYMSNFPPAEIAGGVCTDTYTYHSLDYQGYELDFCLPRAVDNLKAGINVARR